MENKKGSKQVRVGISIGDMNGISPEVVIKSLMDPRILQGCLPIIYGSSKVLSFYKKELNLNDFNYQTIQNADEAKGKKVFVINVSDAEPDIKPGEISEEAGKLSYDALEGATRDLASGKVDILVTAPISKEAISKAGFKFPGHTEYLADMSGLEEALMIMVSRELRVGLVTTHIPLKEVSNAINQDLIISKIKAFNSCLIKDFGIRKPKIAVLGINPHAGEGGKMGEEENEIITPAIRKAGNEDVLAFGPFPADGFFGSPSRSEYDGVLAMYHDQGLTAFKALAFDEGVNFTAGLPIVRTSPDHGTAFDIAGKGIASGDSMRQAIYTAIDVYRNIQLDKEITANPLEYNLADKDSKTRSKREEQQAE